MHPLHCLALAVDKSISKLHAIGLLDNLSAQDEYKETEIEFKRAETQMKRLRLDFKRAPNFEVPLLNEDAEVEDNGANSNTKNANNNCAGNKAGPNGDLSESWAGSDDKAAGEGAGSGAGEGTGSCKDNGEEDWIPISTTTHPCTASKLPLWGLHLSNVNTTTPLPSNEILNAISL
ncbi:hypothetical protein RHS03_09032, partial [Rhizoctonia solani]